MNDAASGAITDPPVTITRAGIVEGAWKCLPVTLFVAVFGAVFGAAAVNAGLTPAMVIVMSMTVAAGAAQLATVEFWNDPVQIGAILVVVTAVNSRNILMGASLYPWLKQISPGARFFTANVVYEPNWVLGLNSFKSGGRDAGVVLGGGLVIYVAFVGGSAAGALLGGLMADPARYGLDVLMITFFASLLAGMARQAGTAVVLPWLVAAGVAVIAHHTLPPGWSIAIGGVAGALTGALRGD